MPAAATAAIDDTQTMAPLPCSRMTGTTCLHVSPGSKATADVLAVKHKLDPAFLKRWIDVLALDPAREDARPGREVPAVKLELLDDKIDGPNAWIRGWKKKGTDLPTLVGNRSNEEQHIPGTVPAPGSLSTFR